MVVWRSVGQDGDLGGIFLRRFDAAGIPIAGELQVNTYTTSDQRSPSLAADAEGNFVVTWTSDGQDGSGYGAFARMFGAAGNAIGNEYRVNGSTIGDQSLPKVGVDFAGNFVITWVNSASNSDDIIAQRFLPGGVPVGGEFRVNSFTANSQWNSVCTMDADGDFVVAWQSAGQDGDNWGVYGQRYTVVPQIASVQVNDGAAQRSMDTSLTVRFSKQVLFSGPAANAFIINGPGGQVSVEADLSQSTPSGTVARLTFSSPGLVGGSLNDGNYTLIVNGNLILDDRGQNLDGDANGTFGGNYLFNFHRLFGDADGDRSVTASDFIQFRLAFGGVNFAFDFDGDGAVAASDFIQFRLRFGGSI